MFPIISLAVIVPLHADNSIELAELITMIIPIMWMLLTIFYLIFSGLIYSVIKNGLHRSIFAFGFAYLTLSWMFRIQHWPGVMSTQVVGYSVLLIGVAILVWDVIIQKQRENNAL